MLHVQQKICPFCGHLNAYRHRSFKCHGWSIDVSLKIITIAKKSEVLRLFLCKKRAALQRVLPKNI